MQPGGEAPPPAPRPPLPGGSRGRPLPAAPPRYLELEGALGALGDLLVEALLGVVRQLEGDLGGPRCAGRKRHEEQRREPPAGPHGPGTPRRHRPARGEARRDAEESGKNRGRRRRRRPGGRRRRWRGGGAEQGSACHPEALAPGSLGERFRVSAPSPAGGVRGRERGRERGRRRGGAAQPRGPAPAGHGRRAVLSGCWLRVHRAQLPGGCTGFRAPRSTIEVWSDARSPRNGSEKQSRCSRPGETEHGDGLSSSASRAAKRSLLQRETVAVRVLALTARINFGFRCCPRKISVTGFTTNKSKIISILTLKLLKW